MTVCYGRTRRGGEGLRADWSAWYEAGSSMEAEPMRRPFRKKFLILCVKLLVVLVLGAAVLSHMDLRGAAKVLTAQTLIGIGFMQLALAATALLGAYRHAMLVSRPRAPLVPCLLAMSLAAGLNLVIPGRVSELIKATYLRQRLQVPLANGTAAIVVERLFDVLVVAMIGLYGVVGLYAPNAALLYVLLVLAIGGLLLLVPLSRLLLPWFEVRKARFWAFVADNCRHVLAVVKPRTCAMVLLLTVLSWGIHYFGVWLFFAVQPGYELNLWQAAIIFSTIMFAGAVPALPGGVGLIQAAVTLALVQMGFETGEALMLSIALHVAEILISALVAPVVLLVQPSGLVDLLKGIRQPGGARTAEVG